MDLSVLKISTDSVIPFLIPARGFSIYEECKQIVMRPEKMPSHTPNPPKPVFFELAYTHG